MPRKRATGGTKAGNGARNIDAGMLAEALEHLDYAVTVLDRDLRLAYYNDAFLTVQDIPADLIRVGMDIADVVRFYAERGDFGPVDIEAFVRERLEILGRFEPRHVIFHRPDGKVVELNGYPRKGGGYINAYADITEHLREAEQRNLSNQRRALHLRRTPLGIVEFDHDFRIVQWNPAAERIFGFTADEVIGRHPFGLIVSKRAERAIEPVWKGLTSGAGADVNVNINENITKDGRRIICEWYNTPLEDLDGNLIGVASLVNDVTARKRAEAELRRQKSLLEAVFRDVPDAMLLTTVDNRAVSCNPAFTRIFGYELGELRGRDLGFLCADGVVPELSESEEEELAERQPPQPLIVQYRCKDGRVFPGETLGTTVRNRNGKAIAVLWLARDVSERLRMAEALRRANDELELRIEERTHDLTIEIADREATAKALRASQARMRDFARAASDWFWETGPDHRFTFVSESYMEATGQPRSFVLGRSRWEVADPAQIAENAEIWEQHRSDLENQRPFRDFETRVLLADGSTVTTATSGIPCYDEDGTFIGFRGIARNINAQKAAEAQLRSAKESAELANRAKSEFLAIMSHELRTPLNAIIGFADAIQKGVFGPIGNERYQEYIGSIKESGDHLLQLITDILDVSVIEVGALELSEEDVDPSAVAATSARLLRPHAEKGQVDLSVRFEAMPLKLRADERRLKQVLVNLLSNAVKFTPAGGHVELGGRLEDDGRLALYVRDDGIGMDADGIRTALMPFGQVDSSLGRRYEGTGLGLPLCIALVQAHDGTLDIDSAPNRGTTVTIRLPADRVVAA